MRDRPLILRACENKLPLRSTYIVLEFLIDMINHHFPPFKVNLFCLIE